MKTRFAIPLAVGAIVSALALYLSFRNVPFHELWTYLGTIRYFWILPSIALILSTFFLRALRWQIILREAAKIGFWQAFHPMMIGFMMNCVLPARVGEIARPAILKKQQGVAFSTGVSTVLAERIFDVLMLVLMFVVFFTQIDASVDMRQNYFGFDLSSQMLITLAWGMAKLSIVLLAGAALLIIGYTRNLMKSLIARFTAWVAKLVPSLKTIAEKTSDLTIKIIDNFYIGLTLIKNPARLLATAALTVCIWGISALSFWIFSLGCPGIDLTFVELTTVLVIICFFIALPSVPGFWGLWEAAGVFGLAIFGIAQRDALGFTMVNHAAQIFPVILTGLISAMLTSVSFWRISKHDTVMELQGSSQ